MAAACTIRSGLFQMGLHASCRVLTGLVSEQTSLKQAPQPLMGMPASRGRSAPTDATYLVPGKVVAARLP